MHPKSNGQPDWRYQSRTRLTMECVLISMLVMLITCRSLTIVRQNSKPGQNEQSTKTKGR